MSRLAPRAGGLAAPASIAFLIASFFWSGIPPAVVIPAAEAQDGTVQALVLDVVDGDTVKVKIGGKSASLRLIGIDAPESSVNDRAFKQAERTRSDVGTILKLGERAKVQLRKLLPRGAQARIEFDAERKDRYGRLLGYIFYGSEMINERMLADGYAKLLTVPPNTRYDRRLRRAHDDARRKAVGLWSAR